MEHAEVSEHPKDECECGDYREVHAGGTGRCCMPDDLTHGNTPCLSFRLAFPHEGPGSRAAIEQDRKNRETSHDNH